MAHVLDRATAQGKLLRDVHRLAISKVVQWQHDHNTAKHIVWPVHTTQASTLTVRSGDRVEQPLAYIPRF